MSALGYTVVFTASRDKFIGLKDNFILDTQMHYTKECIQNVIFIINDR